MKVPTPRLLFSLLLTLLLASPGGFAAPSSEVPPGLADGPGLWANVWHYPQGDLDEYCKNLRQHGIRNIFIQSTRPNMPAVARPDELGALIDAAHRHKIRVIAWAFLELLDPIADAERMVSAARFRSPGGDSIDAIAPDLEKNLQEDRIVKFSQHLRTRLGAHYPMIACVYSPLNRAQEVAGIPWKTVAKYYDIIAPMNYWNSKYQKLDPYEYTMGTISRIRQLTGKPDVEIHVVGDGMGTSPQAIQQFLKACKHAEATSASLYPNHKPTPEQLVTMSRYRDYFAPNARFRLAAFRQMIRRGAIEVPADANPAKPITRGHFYRMVVAHSKGTMTAPDLSNAEMSAPIYADEALTVLSQLVDSHSSKKKRNPADRWFAPPAAAETLSKQRAGSKPLNFLDASQMVVQASSAIR